jgi:hypothetical protein
MSKSQIRTALYCQSCGARLLWQGENRIEPKLEPDGTLRGFTLHVACIHCRSKYEGWLYVGAAPVWWEETRADKSRSTHKHDDLKNHQRASRKRAVKDKPQA